MKVPRTCTYCMWFAPVIATRNLEQSQIDMCGATCRRRHWELPLGLDFEAWRHLMLKAAECSDYMKWYYLERDAAYWAAYKLSND